MITTLQYLGIYEDDIENAVKQAEKAVELFGLDVEELNERAEEFLNNTICGLDNITNKIIAAYFMVAESMIAEKNSDICIAYYVNCYDSDFYINNQNVNGIDDLQEV